MNDHHLCHCGHEQLFHYSTNNRCMIVDCPCSEGFQSKTEEMSPKLRTALEDRDQETRALLRGVNKP